MKTSDFFAIATQIGLALALAAPSVQAARNPGGPAPGLRFEESHKVVIDGALQNTQSSRANHCLYVAYAEMASSFLDQVDGNDHNELLESIASAHKESGLQLVVRLESEAVPGDGKDADSKSLRARVVYSIVSSDGDETVARTVFAPLSAGDLSLNPFSRKKIDCSAVAKWEAKRVSREVVETLVAKAADLRAKQIETGE